MLLDNSFKNHHFFLSSIFIPVIVNFVLETHVKFVKLFNRNKYNGNFKFILIRLKTDNLNCLE